MYDASVNIHLSDSPSSVRMCAFPKMLMSSSQLKNPNPPVSVGQKTATTIPTSKTASAKGKTKFACAPNRDSAATGALDVAVMQMLRSAQILSQIPVQCPPRVGLKAKQRPLFLCATESGAGAP